METELRETLLDFKNFFKEVEDNSWLSIFDRLLLYDTVDCHFLNQLSNLYGGMGSINDLCILRINGHNVVDEDEAKYKLDKLRNELYTIINSYKLKLGC